MSSPVGGAKGSLDEFVEVDWNPLDEVEFVIKEEPQAIFDFHCSKRAVESTSLRLMGRSIRVYNLSEQEKEKEIETAFNGLLEPAFKQEALTQAIEMFLKKNGDKFPQIAENFQKIAPEMRLEPFKTKFVCSQYLGGGFLRWISPFLKTCWLLRKEQVPKLLEMTEHFESFAQKKGNNQEIALAQSLKQKFAQKKDYLLEDEELGEILPVTKRALEEARLELLKTEIRGYFHVEDLRARVTEEMYQKIEQIIQKLSIVQREALGDELEKAHSLDEKRKLLSALDVEFHFSEEEERVFFDVLKMIVPFPVEEFLRPIEDEEVREKPLSNLELFRECLEVFEKNVLNSLERTCLNAKMMIEFRQKGYDIRLGALPVDLDEIDRVIDANSEVDDETVLV